MTRASFPVIPTLSDRGERESREAQSVPERKDIEEEVERQM